MTTRTIYLITAKGQYTSEPTLIAAYTSEDEANSIVAMINTCSPVRKPEVAAVELRGDFPIFHAITPPYPVPAVPPIQTYEAFDQRPLPQEKNHE